MTKGILVILLTASLVWGQQITISGQYSGSGRIKTESQLLLHQSTFETGDCSEWTAAPWGCNIGDLFINTVNPNSGSYSMEIYYHAGAGLDHTRGLRQTISPARDYLHIRGYVYIKTPTGDIDGVQRKLIWTANNAAFDEFSHFLTSDSAAGNIPLRMASNGSIPCGITSWSDYSIYTINYDTRYVIEIAIQMNTPGVLDGEYWLWVDGVERWHGTGRDFRGSCTSGIGSYSLGYQVQGDQATDEYRYWDDVKVSTGYIGP